MGGFNMPLNPMAGNPSGFNMFGTSNKNNSQATMPNFSLFGNTGTQGNNNPASFMPGFSSVFGGFNPMKSPVAGLNPSQTLFTNGMDTQGIIGDLMKTYGKGYGSLLSGALFGGGGFNPAVAQAQMAAMMPGFIRSQNDLLSAFGAEGNRFSSGAALGLGDLAANFDLGQSQIFANEYEQGVNNILSLMTGLAPTMHAEQANKSNLFDQIAGGLEIAAGIAGAPFTGGATLPLVGSGVATMGAGMGGGGGSGAGAGAGMIPNFGGFKSIFGGGNNNPLGLTIPQNMPSVDAQIMMNASGGDVLQGGSGDMFSGSGMMPWMQSGYPL